MNTVITPVKLHKRKAFNTPQTIIHNRNDLINKLKIMCILHCCHTYIVNKDFYSTSRKFSLLSILVLKPIYLQRCWSENFPKQKVLRNLILVPILNQLSRQKPRYGNFLKRKQKVNFGEEPTRIMLSGCLSIL